MDSYEKASQEKVELELRIKEAELREAALSAKVSSRIEWKVKHVKKRPCMQKPDILIVKQVLDKVQTGIFMVEEG